MFWNKKKSKSKPQIKTPTPKPIKTKEPPPKWEPPFGETKKKEVKSPEPVMKAESKIDWEDKFLKSSNSSHTDIEHGTCGEIIFYFTHVPSRTFWTRKTMIKERNDI